MDIVDPHYYILSMWIFKIRYYYSKRQTYPIDSGTVSHPKSTQITIGQWNFLQFWSVSGHSLQVQLGCILVLLAHLQLGLRWVGDFESTPGRPARVSNNINFQGGTMKLLLEALLTNQMTLLLLLNLYPNIRYLFYHIRGMTPKLKSLEIYY